MAGAWEGGRGIRGLFTDSESRGQVGVEQEPGEALQEGEWMRVVEVAAGMWTVSVTGLDTARTPG